jgi:hypothetical protein
MFSNMDVSYTLPEAQVIEYTSKILPVLKSFKFVL